MSDERADQDRQVGGGSDDEELRCTCIPYWSSIPSSRPCAIHGMFNREPHPNTKRREQLSQPSPTPDEAATWQAVVEAGLEDGYLAARDKAIGLGLVRRAEPLVVTDYLFESIIEAMLSRVDDIAPMVRDALAAAEGGERGQH